ncbi:hypothetical protein [Ramlibacter sp. WS9]|uniref:hypothetical protein n=1 Tax=Ramlibacter sp. WS9 TaxID=1882741 RepID=UPI0011411DF8|nr:hypothetical protein [Ramlibacter sp. WS9]ROZ69617.1 hypothetical protein EEB15_22200 [Ramlibacter sp. WS9]
MAPETQPSLRASRGQEWIARLRRLRLPRARWVYVLVALALLAASQVLWLWHSWPVREILESEKLVVGATV